MGANRSAYLTEDNLARHKELQRGEFSQIVNQAMEDYFGEYKDLESVMVELSKQKQIKKESSDKIKLLEKKKKDFENIKEETKQSEQSLTEIKKATGINEELFNKLLSQKVSPPRTATLQMFRQYGIKRNELLKAWSMIHNQN